MTTPAEELIDETIASHDKSLEKSGGYLQMHDSDSGASVFDPVLCEVMYKWFSPEAGTIIDPFAGGSVRGIVAAKSNRIYTGVELRQGQVDANRLQADELCKTVQKPTWLCGDSMYIDKIVPSEKFDMVFSCPPYGNLEVYSDDPKDISKIAEHDYQGFLSAYDVIIAKTCSMLKEDRFACFVVGDFRDKKTGLLRNFVSDTIAAFQKAGLGLYNHIIFATPMGSAAIRAGAMFKVSRKVCPVHQNILVFLKGNAKAATAACGNVEVPDIMPADAAVTVQDMKK